MKWRAEDIQAFVNATSNYFTTIVGAKPEFGIPYSLDAGTKKYPLHAYSGHVGVSGSHRGGIVLTCEKGLVAELLCHVLGSDSASEEEIIHMLAELVNTVAGNARLHFGGGFEISVPTVVIGEPEEFKFVLAEPSLVLPFTWNNFQANAIIGLV